MNILLDKSLINCHTQGLDSIIIKDAPGMIRLFVARRDHQLWRNDIKGRNAWSVAMHRHHCDVTLQPILGEVSNISIDKDAEDSISMFMYKYEPPITGTHGKFTLIEDYALPLRLRADLVTKPLFLPYSQPHSVYVPYGQPAAWYIWEGAEYATYKPLVYSNTDLRDFDFSPLNQPMTEQRLLEDLALIGVTTYQL